MPATTETSGARHRHPLGRTAKVWCIVAAAVIATLLLPAQSVAHAQSAAGFQQATAKCWPGPSGNVCARMFYNSSTKTWRGYAAADPNPGKSIQLLSVNLNVCATPDNSRCTFVSNHDARGNPKVYQRLTTDGKGPACYWKSTAYYTAAGNYYVRDSPFAGLC